MLVIPRAHDESHCRCLESPAADGFSAACMLASDVAEVLEGVVVAQLEEEAEFVSELATGFGVDTMTDAHSDTDRCVSACDATAGCDVVNLISLGVKPNEVLAVSGDGAGCLSGVISAGVELLIAAAATAAGDIAPAAGPAVTLSCDDDTAAGGD